MAKNLTFYYSKKNLIKQQPNRNNHISKQSPTALFNLSAIVVCPVDILLQLCSLEHSYIVKETCQKRHETTSLGAEDEGGWGVVLLCHWFWAYQKTKEADGAECGNIYVR